MQAGKLDRRIVIERTAPVQSASGEPIDDWCPLATVWAQRKPMKGGERFAQQQRIATALATFVVRFRADLMPTVKDRIVADGRTWDILDIREIGRRTGLEIDAMARADT